MTIQHQVKGIKPEEVGRFGIDEKNNLYWDGHLVHTEAALKLTPLQRAVAIAAGCATILSSFAASANAWYTYKYKQPVPVCQPASGSSPSAAISGSLPTQTAPPASPGPPPASHP